ncbi:sigma 54-interacting transcriptional regulator [Roseimicrobium sp. ORNL1]|uniref:sigma-54-dependent Fis family transcriptional regulator n=1 Tax=Roseimicrobium sp. ORNL1 TaxID=2711231 RepID=UPI0013E138BA|nr:sigma 54-interacting transcriptional regulator [Roseimicrobium sp. ORNL1]QIF06211.1 GAF domain-containing protein [Roseimicrobium sp. ORNL1]
MVSIAQNRTLPEVLQSIVAEVGACKNVVVTCIWLIDRGDLCETCRFRAKCPDQSRCLHLVASAGNLEAHPQDLTPTDIAFGRLPLGVPKIGKVAATGESLLQPQLSDNEDWISDTDWFRSEGVRAFAAHPLVFRGEVLGVLAVFDRMALNEADFEYLRVFADHAAVSIANANAFEEIARLKERLEEENDYLREEVTTASGTGYFIGESPALKKVLRQIDLVAATDATVLVTGESGTGKELVARAIHERSSRRNRPMVKANCAAVPEALFESEFFGHVRGAFTGALRDKLGRFELADGGTLFLDEIGEIPYAMQAKLLRVLQEQEVERVGDTRSRKVNVRIIAATNRSLKDEVIAGRFREDLFYRLSVFPIENPPLRERREDIPRLAEHFIHVFAKRLGRKPPRLTAVTNRQLAAQDWPGNVRELQNTIERAVILAESGSLSFEAPALSVLPSAAPSPALVAASEGFLLTRSELKQRERESISAALTQTHGKIFGHDGAAALLGMKPTTLASRIKALGLQRK